MPGCSRRSSRLRSPCRRRDRRGGTRGDASPRRRRGRRRRRSPAASRPLRSARASTCAAFTVHAESASSGASPICVAASEQTSGRLSQKALPGLKSVASATAAPASTSARAGGIGRLRKSALAGRSTPVTSLAASAAIPLAPVASRWSTDRAPSSIASGIAPDSVNWSPCRRSASPASRHAVRYRRAWSASNAPRSRKTSAASASFAASGSTSPSRKSRYASAPASANSGGTVCAPSHVGMPPASLNARSCASSVSRSSPYPDFASNVVVPARSIQPTCSASAAARPVSPAARVARTVERMPPPRAWSSSYDAPPRAARTPPRGRRRSTRACGSRRGRGSPTARGRRPPRRRRSGRRSPMRPIAVILPSSQST